jgi:type IV pilus assembly protein PilX
MTPHVCPPPRVHARALSRRGPARAQSGAVLVIGLIILVVLTLLGVQGMRTNVAQERMAGNMRERNVAFQAAEAALRQGESVVPQGSAPAPLPDIAGWDGVAGPGVGSVGGFTDGVGNPVFHIGPPVEILIGIDGGQEVIEIYPVTARGVGFQPGSVVVIQSDVIPAN